MMVIFFLLLNSPVLKFYQELILKRGFLSLLLTFNQAVFVPTNNPIAYDFKRSNFISKTFTIEQRDEHTKKEQKCASNMEFAHNHMI